MEPSSGTERPNEVPPPTNYAILFTGVGVAVTFVVAGVAAFLANWGDPGPAGPALSPAGQIALSLALLLGPPVLVTALAALVFGRRLRRVVLATAGATYLLCWLAVATNCRSPST